MRAFSSPCRPADRLCARWRRLLRKRATSCSSCFISGALQTFQSTSDAASERCWSCSAVQEERWGWTLCSSDRSVAELHTRMNTARDYAESPSRHLSREAVVEKLGTDLRKRVSVVLMGAACPSVLWN
jgi:hypothetical protein